MSFIIFSAGLAVGSFLNVVIARLATRQSIFWGHSRCPYCNHALSVADLIPLVSYIFLAGRCRYCKKLISWQYPAVELGTGLAFALVAFTFSDPFDLVFWLFFVASFVVIVTFDAAKQEIPQAIVWPLLGGALWYVLLPFVIERNLAGAFNEIIAGLITGGLILFIVLITKEKAMGMGDVPIAALLGLLLGYPRGLYALVLAFVLGAVAGITLISLRRAGLKTAVPFAPFLIAGLLIFVFFGSLMKF